MRIILDFYSFQPEIPESSNFLKDVCIEIAVRNPNHSFIFLAFEPLKKIGDLPENVSIHYVNRYFSKLFGRKMWFKYRLSKELAKLRATLYVSVDNFNLAKLNIPLCFFLIHGNRFLNEATTSKNVDRSRKQVLKSIENANTIITFSDDDQEKILASIPLPEIKIKSIPPLYGVINELIWTEKEMAKIDFAAGVEYFAFVGDLHERYDLIGLLKAFSLFKKWQQSNMQLVIAGNKTSTTREFSQKLESFKYRREVTVIINPSKEKINKIIGGAYAFVYPSLFDHFPLNIFKAIQAGAPVISAVNPVCKELFADTLMYPETNEPEELAKCLQLMYRDEHHRSDLISAAKDRLLLYEKVDIAEACLNFFEETIAK